MVDGCLEQDVRRRVGVVCGVVDSEFEGETGVRCVDRAGEGGVPFGDVGAGGEGGEAGGWGGHHCHELGLQAAWSCQYVGLCFAELNCGYVDIPLDDISVGGCAGRAGALSSLVDGGCGGHGWVHGVQSVCHILSPR